MERKICLYLDKVDEMLKGEFVPPVTCEIDPSNVCNLSCYFCMYKDFRARSHSMLNINVFRELIVELSDLGTKSITFTGGGEPTIHPDFNTMVKMAASLDFEIGLVTNGVLLDKIEYPELFKFIRISLDAYDLESYLKIKGKNYFHKVRSNIKDLVNRDLTDVGISYVVCSDNEAGISVASDLANDLGVKYIQFKPAWINGNRTEVNGIPDSIRSVKTNRYIAENTLPCTIAGLIGIVGADGNVYYCCQYRGNDFFKLGSLSEESFRNLWIKRKDIIPDITKCPQCRYMNYAKGYEEFSQPKFQFLRHTNFL